MNTFKVSAYVAAMTAALALPITGARAVTMLAIEQDATAEVNPPAGYVTYRVLLNLAEGSHVLGISSGENGLSFATDDPCGLLNDPESPYAGLASDDFPQSPDAATWDSWITIGTDCCVGAVDLGPTGSPDAVVVGTEWSAPPGTGGWTDPDSSDDETFPILIAQFTLRATAAFTFTGHVSYLDERGMLQDGYFIALAEGNPEGGSLCGSDLDSSGGVGFNDLLLMLAAWGPCVDDCCVIDLDHDGAVGFADLLQLLSEWGPCR